MTPAPDRLVVFARAPELGKVKTRLSPPLTAEGALDLHRAMVEDTLERLSRSFGREVDRVLYWSEPTEIPTPGDFSFRTQKGPDLGARLTDAMTEAFSAGCARVVILGTDSPTLPINYVKEAWEALARVDAVLGPAEDGGYYLVGCRTPIREIFEEIPWGTSTVLAATRERLARAGRTLEVLPPWYDVDRVPDLARLKEEVSYLEENAPDEVPRRTAAALGAIGPESLGSSPEPLRDGGGAPSHAGKEPQRHE